MALNSNRPSRTFLGLPPEIRLMIYKQDLEQRRILIVHEYCPERKRNAYKAYNVPGILFVCHFIHHEVIPTVYAESHFVFNFGEKPVYGINAFARRVGSINANLIKKITIWLDEFYPRDSCYIHNNPLQRLHGWVRHFPRLQELRLKYSTEVPDHHFVAEGTITALNAERYGGFFNKMLVLLESRRQETFVYEFERGMYTITGTIVKIVERLSLAHDHLPIDSPWLCPGYAIYHLRLENFMDRVAEDERNCLTQPAVPIVVIE
ncbi:MAG: hypothetical protein Q9212_002851 [Teloschistes hypoglaucus]